MSSNQRIERITPLLSPHRLLAELPFGAKRQATVEARRVEVERVLLGQDRRLMVVLGPCSIHDSVAAIEYAERVAAAQQHYRDELLLVMRVYLEKPRTVLGWKGFINDPHLDGSFDIETGLRLSRELLMRVTDLGLPIATEFLDTIVPQFTADLIALGVIGARTTESQPHRELASGLSMPVGFKNGTGGSLEIAVNAIVAATQPHHFIGVDDEGKLSVVATRGNPLGYLIMRGARSGPNYDSQHIERAGELLREHGVTTRLLVDCSHANSGGDYRRQSDVVASVARQRAAGQELIAGVMLESNLVAGAQKLTAQSRLNLVYGQSITDACQGWDETEVVLKYWPLPINDRAGLTTTFGVLV